LLSTLLYIVSVNLVPEGSWGLFGGFLALLVLAVATSRVGFRALVRRVLLAGPFLAALLSVPFVTPGPEFWSVPLVGWTVTEPGLLRFGTLVARFLLSVPAAVLLVLVTTPPSLFNAMRRLGMPSLLLSVVSLTYRYLSVIPEEGHSMMRARKARSAALGRKPSALWQARVAGNMVGSLFLRSLDRSERIFAAMLSRGYDGTVRYIDDGGLRGADWLVLASWGLIVFSVVVWRLS
jgi:cobalt/nickel transport system permease protein